MQVTTARRILLLMWLGLAGTIIARETQRGFVPPRPAVFVPGLISYTAFAGLGEVAPAPAVLLAGLFDMAAILTPFLSNPKTSPLASVFTWLDTTILGGK